MMICTSGAVICEPPMIVGVASTIVSGRGMVLCSRKIIGDVARLIVSVAEKIELLTALIAEGMEILLSQPVTIADDVEIIVKETELIVTTVSSKGSREEDTGRPTIPRRSSGVLFRMSLGRLRMFPFPDKSRTLLVRLPSIPNNSVLSWIKRVCQRSPKSQSVRRGRRLM